MRRVFLSAIAAIVLAAPSPAPGQILPPPAGQRARALNHAVELEWVPITDPGGMFQHYAIYRATQPFTSVAGFSPIATVGLITHGSFKDTTALNGVSYHYAVTSVDTGGGQATAVNSIGPRTPRSETDLQVLSIARTPRYPRYDPIYTGYNIIEPGGFGPYHFTAATGLGMGQTAGTQRWPAVGQTVTYTATIRNRGTNPVSGVVSGEWTIDGQVVSQPAVAVNLQPGQWATFTLDRTWDDAIHDITFEITTPDARPGNNSLTRGSKGVGFLTYADESFIEDFRENTPVSYPQAATDDLFDWLSAHMARFNDLFAAAGSDKRVHYEILEPLDDLQADPAVPTINFAVFPFRYRAGEGDPRLSGYYNAGEDIDFGLLHEMGHQLGLIDLYQLDTPGSINLVSGLAYAAPDGLMRNVAPFLSEHSALAMQHWLHIAHGYYGQYMYALPETITMRFLGLNGQPLAGATVKVYQRIEQPGVGPVIPNVVKFQGVTDSAGLYTLPNVPIDPQKVPTTFAGDTLKPNPFGYIAVVGTNGLLHFQVEHNGYTDYAWLDITEPNIAYWKGQTANAVFDREMNLGGEVQRTPPADMAELNAASWSTWTQSGSGSVHDDAGMKQAGGASLRFETTGGFDTLVRYPGDRLAAWDCSAVQTIRFHAFAQNQNIGFQEGSPWVRLISNDGWIEWRSATTILNAAINQWQFFEIPIAGSGEWIRTQSGSPDLARVTAIEIHADTWGAGFTLWLDGVGFDPNPCYADCDHSGALDLFDFLCFTNRFGAGDPAADCDSSGGLDLFDFLCFVNEFQAGCG